MKTKRDPRHCARQVALQTLFEWHMHSIDPQIIAKRIITETENDNIDYDLLNDIIENVVAHKKDIDEQIHIAAPQWPLSQISKIELTILRIAVTELQYLSEIPEKVTIDEAVELSKEFSTEVSGKFINGVLGTVLKNLNIKKENPKP